MMTGTLADGRRGFTPGIGLITGCLLLTPLGAHSLTQAPTLKLFPTTVLEEIRHTGSVAREMETGLQAVIARLDEQQQLFVASKCEGDEGDPGCEQIARQLGATYLEMLNIMGDKLPAMETAVNSTTVSLEKRIRKELGQKKTPWTLQELLISEDTGKDNPDRPALRGRSGMRLSDRFNQYYRLVAGSGSRVNSSLAVVASDIYLDMQETSHLIARTREEINRATLMEQLNQSFGTITPEMQEVVSGVKAILFGEEETLTLSAPPDNGPAQEYTSPLQL